jgi:hypothetical protein
MNSKNLFIGVSLILNVALAIALVRQPTGEAATERLVIEADELGEENLTPSSNGKTNADLEETSETNRTFTWEAVESGDYLTYIENLRTIGCPEETIRDIISADVNKLFDQRWKEIKKASGTGKFEANLSIGRAAPCLEA